ncbi:MAG: DUF4918 family protein [Chitinophagaceae bacterium]
MNFADSVLSFIKKLSLPIALHDGIEVMTPFDNAETMKACRSFYKKFYNDNLQRRMIIGINPGRFGGGITGIPFTDPIRLQNDCGIANEWAKKQELSSLYIYEMINAFGGIETFYKQYYFTSISPLGFVRNGKNLNYYDDKKLQQDIKPFAIDCLKRQFKFGIDRNIAFCLGDGKNFAFLSKLNEAHGFFEKIVPLSHPRFIMQYRLKKKQEYIDDYLNKLKQ